MNKSRDRHVWLEDDQGIIMNLTADQFFGDDLYIGDYNSFYKSLEIVSKKKPYDISQHRNLSYDYECILNYI